MEGNLGDRRGYRVTGSLAVWALVMWRSDFFQEPLDASIYWNLGTPVIMIVPTLPRCGPADGEYPGAQPGRVWRLNSPGNESNQLGSVSGTKTTTVIVTEVLLRYWALTPDRVLHRGQSTLLTVLGGQRGYYPCLGLGTLTLKGSNNPPRSIKAHTVFWLRVSFTMKGMWHSILLIPGYISF